VIEGDDSTSATVAATWRAGVMRLKMRTPARGARARIAFDERIASRHVCLPAHEEDDDEVHEIGPDEALARGRTDLAAPAGSKLVFHVYATGVQIYRWNGTAWAFVAPDATLSADAGGRGKVGIHYAGPTWESNSGSKVVGMADERCTPSASAIPWLTLNVVSASGPGIFDRVTFIQRLNTTGGLAPSSPGTAVGDVARVPYTAEYFFYR
jgi:hypothetical protein